MAQQRAEETRQHILQSAQALFAKNGYDATGVAEICQSAGVSKGAFYHHFAGKQAVFLRLLEDWLAQLEPRLAGLTREGERMPAALVEITSVFGEIFASSAGQLPMFLEFWVQASRDPLVWERTIAPYHHFTELFSGLMEQGMQAGTLRSMESGVAARVLMSLAMGLIVQGLFDPHGADWERVAQEGVQILMDGMVRRAA